MEIATKAFLKELDAKSEARKKEILNAPDELTVTGTTYYVSNEGDDQNDGRTPATAWRTVARVSDAELCPGDGVRFCRGDLFRGILYTKPGVGYGSYGKGEKPKLYGWDKSFDDPALWEIYDEDLCIWHWKEKVPDVGTLVFNDGEAHSYKHIPSYLFGKFVCRNDENKVFDMRREMIRDLDIYWYYEDEMTSVPTKGEDFPVPKIDKDTKGDLYLRCDRGNPGEVFSSIEGTVRRCGIMVGRNENVTVDNLCIKYVGIHGIAAAGPCVKGLTVTNCEIGWIGGVIFDYSGIDPNYPEGRRGSIGRFGNAIEIYGGCDNYTVRNCYIYQSYDAGITHQINTFGNKYTMTNVLYKDNLVERCVYSIEYFLNMTPEDHESYMKNIEMCGNILRFSGYGWGQQRHNVHTPAHIKGWSFTNVASEYSVHDNLFDRSAYRLVHLVAEKQESCPKMWGNTYVQYEGGMIGQYGGKENGEPPIEIFDENAEKTVRELFKDEGARVYIIQKNPV